MPLTETVRIKIIKLYCIIFLFILLYIFVNHGFLSQVVPSFFYNRLDFSIWIVQLTGLHLLFLNNKTACLIADLLFALLPFIYLLTYLKNKRLSFFIAVLMVVVNFIFAILATIFSLNAIEQMVAFILFPITFLTLNLSTFWFLFQGLRYFFLYFFTSAGLWKLVQGGAFNTKQMSGILIYQHKELLLSTNDSVQTMLYRWLIVHPSVAYLLYLIAAVLEIFFIVGFFTKKLDKVLLILFLTFLIMDAIVMRINYWETAPFLITLLYSKYRLPAETRLAKMV